MTNPNAHDRLLRCLRDEMDSITASLKTVSGELHSILFRRLRRLDETAIRLERHIWEPIIEARYPVGETLSDIIG